MILGMLPLAAGIGLGHEFRQGMAIVIIGGLTSSMLLTLVLVPVMYTFIESWRTKFPRFFKKILFLGKVKKSRDRSMKLHRFRNWRWKLSSR